MVEGQLVVAAIALSAETAAVPVVPGVAGAARFGLADLVAADRIAVAACACQVLVGALKSEIRRRVVIEFP